MSFIRPLSDIANIFFCKVHSSFSKIGKDENGESVPPLEIGEVILVHCNVVCNN